MVGRTCSRLAHDPPAHGRVPECQRRSALSARGSVGPTASLPGSLGGRTLSAGRRGEHDRGVLRRRSTVALPTPVKTRAVEGGRVQVRRQCRRFAQPRRRPRRGASPVTVVTGDAGMPAGPRLVLARLLGGVPEHARRAHRRRGRPTSRPAEALATGGHDRPPASATQVPTTELGPSTGPPPGGRTPAPQDSAIPISGGVVDARPPVEAGTTLVPLAPARGRAPPPRRLRNEAQDPDPPPSGRMALAQHASRADIDRRTSYERPGTLGHGRGGSLRWRLRAAGRRCAGCAPRRRTEPDRTGRRLPPKRAAPPLPAPTRAHAPSAEPGNRTWLPRERPGQSTALPCPVLGIRGRQRRRWGPRQQQASGSPRRPRRGPERQGRLGCAVRAHWCTGAAPPPPQGRATLRWALEDLSAIFRRSSPTTRAADARARIPARSTTRPLTGSGPLPTVQSFGAGRGGELRPALP